MAEKHIGSVRYASLLPQLRAKVAAVKELRLLRDVSGRKKLREITGREIEQRTREVANAAHSMERTELFIRLGATHLFLGKNGDLRFVRTNDKRGKNYQPIVGATRMPLAIE